MTLDLSSPILIVGAGTFGLSTAWHLARRGYTDVTVMDRHPAPSAASAGNDLNKIFRTEYADALYSKLATESREAWLSEPVLAGCYRENGYIFCNYQQAVANSRALGVEFEDLSSAADFREKAPFLDGPMKDWKGVFNPKAGWTHASNSLLALATECVKLGVKFIDGDKGTMESLVKGTDGSVLGVVAIDGTRHLAVKTVLAAGAWIDSLVDTHGQLLAKGWCFAHIRLTAEEASAWRDAPVINNRELGYMFEPDAVNRMLKVSPHLPGYTNYDSPSRSVPRSQPEHPTDTMPTEAGILIRQFLRECVPSIAEREFSYERICWDSDSPDHHFVIDEHASLRGLTVAGGGSGHGFKFLPIIGRYVCDLLEGRLAPELAEAWRWRPGQHAVADASRPLRACPDLSEMPGWKQ